MNFLLSLFIQKTVVIKVYVKRESDEKKKLDGNGMFVSFFNGDEFFFEAHVDGG
jgi:hypothetical protein